jgi:hypothetical protein
MENLERKNIVKFYESQLYILGMPKSNELTDENLIILKDTLSFSLWMMATNYDYFVNSIKDVIKQVRIWKNK